MADAVISCYDMLCVIVNIIRLPLNAMSIVYWHSSIGTAMNLSQRSVSWVYIFISIYLYGTLQNNNSVCQWVNHVFLCLTQTRHYIMSIYIIPLHHVYV